MQPDEPLHSWEVDPKEAKLLQDKLRDELKLVPLQFNDLKLVGGADMALSKKHGLFFAVIVVLELPGFDVVEVREATVNASYPYIPGLLSFREGPAVLAAFKKLSSPPDVMVFDAQGIAHPRRLGLAAHLGLWLQLPSIGCAKSRLIGEHDEPGPQKGEWEPLKENGEVLGVVLRTRTRVQPLFVSPGHLCDVQSAKTLALQCAVKYRLPEPTRLAHLHVSRMKKNFVEKKD